MEQTIEIRKSDAATELITFYLGNALYGIDILKVQEVNKLMDWTPVPHSEEYVLGILSLRGSIVTVIDLGERLGTVKTKPARSSRNIIVNCDNHCAGFLVDGIGDVATFELEQICQAPANVNGIQGKFFSGVLKTDEKLIAILNIEELFRDTELKTQK